MTEYIVTAINGETGETFTIAAEGESGAEVARKFEEREAFKLEHRLTPSEKAHTLVSVVSAEDPAATSQPVAVGSRIPFPIDETDRVFSVVTDSVGGVYVTDSTETVLAIVDLTYVDATSDLHEAQLLEAVQKAFEQLESNVRYPEENPEIDYCAPLPVEDDDKPMRRGFLDRAADRGEVVALAEDGSEYKVARASRDGSVWLSESPLDDEDKWHGPYDVDQYRVVAYF